MSYPPRQSGTAPKIPSRAAPSVLEIAPGIHVDARRAVWLPETGTLAVSDLHLGYVWAHRHSGQMLPLSANEESVFRLATLVDEYAAQELVLLGDIVHRAVPVPALEKELRRLCEEVGSRTTLHWVAGNHDKRLAQLLCDLRLPVELLTEYRAGPHLLVHGDAPEESAAAHLASVRSTPGRVILGHEHPAFTLSDGVASSLKCPCFAASDELVVLPAFSEWAAGGDIRRRSYLSHYLQLSKPRRAVVCVGRRLLPLSL